MPIDGLIIDYDAKVAEVLAKYGISESSIVDKYEIYEDSGAYRMMITYNTQDALFVTVGAEGNVWGYKGLYSPWNSYSTWYGVAYNNTFTTTSYYNNGSTSTQYKYMYFQDSDYIDSKFRLITDAGTVYTLDKSYTTRQWIGWDTAANDRFAEAQRVTELMMNEAGYDIHDFYNGIHIATINSTESWMWDWGGRSRIIAVKLLDDNTRFVATDVHVFDGYRVKNNHKHYYTNDVNEACVLTGTVSRSNGDYILNPTQRIKMDHNHDNTYTWTTVNNPGDILNFTDYGTSYGIRRHRSYEAAVTRVTAYLRK